MDCREVRQLAEAFVSEQLLVETTHAVIAHLDHCAPCRAEIAGLRRLRAAARSAFANAPGLAPRPEFLDALTTRMRTEASRPSSSRWRVWLVTAASVLIVAGLGVGWRGWSLANMSALLHAAVGDHRYCALDFKLTERPITLEEAARRFGEVNRRLQEVQPSTSMLSGGPLRVLERHSCVFEGRRFAHIVLQYRGQAVSVLVTDEQSPMSVRARLPATDGFHAAAFRESGYVTFVVSALTDDEVQEVTAAMSGPLTLALKGA
jgi:Protein of unknown function (DUF3379)/Putative zinc-finger